jgi:hypothetical protein
MEGKLVADAFVEGPAFAVPPGALFVAFDFEPVCIYIYVCGGVSRMSAFWDLMELRER